LSKTVVIVEDNEAMRHALCRLFHAAEGFRTCGEASDGFEAVELVERLTPDLVVLDMRIPGMNGIEIARKLRDLNVSTRTILYSLDAGEIAEKELHAAGVAAAVTKGEDIKDLIAKARAVLGCSVA
jgi:DNA-binding NarL/FixJ family response regulator